MSASIVRQLVLKDLYLSRWIVLLSTAAGLVSLAIAPLSPTGFYVGSVTYICVLIVLNIFLVTFGVIQEKKDKVQLFVLSLPISTTQYTVAKATANFTAFFVPWLFLSIASLVVIDATGIPNGLMPVTLVLSLFVFCYYCVLLAVGIATEAAFWIPTVIVIGNVSVNFVIFLAFQLPSIGGNAQGEVAVWGGDAIALMAIEIGVGIAALALAFAAQARRREFI